MQISIETILGQNNSLCYLKDQISPWSDWLCWLKEEMFLKEVSVFAIYMYVALTNYPHVIIVKVGK